MIEFVFRDHLGLAVHAAVLFAVGLFVAWPVVHYRLRAVARPPLAVVRLVLRLMGPSPSIARMTAVIVCFNTAAILIYMASGFHPLLPKVFGIWTGMNIGVMMGLARQEEVFEPGRPTPEQWMPAPAPTVMCGLLVLLVELPCFWFAIAMGISLGREVQTGAGPYLAALAVRASAYFIVIVPLLFLSAVAEAVAIRGSGRPGSP